MSEEDKLEASAYNRSNVYVDLLSLIDVYENVARSADLKKILLEIIHIEKNYCKYTGKLAEMVAKAEYKANMEQFAEPKPNLVEIK